MINLLLNQIKQDVYIQNHLDGDATPLLIVKNLRIKFKRNMMIRIDESDYYTNDGNGYISNRIKFYNSPIRLEINLYISSNGSPHVYIDSYNTEFSITKNYLNKWRIKKTQSCDI